ncbi:MAG TPA: class I SAM-dependent methyltransferase [Planctomycetota bacterium]|nr:class I SAM-dependent methyltransferase [Planctomycetota bacterium]
MSHADFDYVPWQTSLLQKAGIVPSRDTVMLDFGCGAGDCVAQFRSAGYRIFGCDMRLPADPAPRLRAHLDEGIVRRIEVEPYRLPFADETFDLVFSNQVFEHVMDYPVALAEISRILKPQGVSVHVFPGRWKWKESHVYVPFASVIRSYWWLKLWALCGIRNEHQAGMSASETARKNRDYLVHQTHYLSRRRIRRHVTQYFDECRFVEEAYFGISPRLQRYVNRFPLLLDVYRAWKSDTHMRVLVFGKKRPTAAIVGAPARAARRYGGGAETA